MKPWPSAWPDEFRRLAAVIPHPDDEVFIAGLLARAASSDVDVRLVCATRGERGWLFGKRATPEVVSDTRTKELDASCDAIGLASAVHLDLPDGGLDAEDPDQVRIVRAAIFDADAVVSYGLDGGYGHRDHIAIARIVAACAPAHLRIAFPDELFADFARRLRRHEPTLFAPSDETERGEVVWELALDAEVARRKRAAIAAHASQLGPAGVFLFDGLEEAIVTSERYRQ